LAVPPLLLLPLLPLLLLLLLLDGAVAGVAAGFVCGAAVRAGGCTALLCTGLKRTVPTQAWLGRRAGSG
jgi:hypothetical protein